MGKKYDLRKNTVKKCCKKIGLVKKKDCKEIEHRDHEYCKKAMKWEQYYENSEEEHIY